MADGISFSQAASAYRDATRVAERIIEETGLGMANEINTQQSNRVNFGELVQESLQRSRDIGYNNEAISAKAMANEAELHELITTVSNAELTLNTVIAVRDKVVNAYQEIMRMPI